MSKLEQKKEEEKAVDWRGVLHPRRSDEKVGLIRDLVTIDKNLWGKTRIPHVFGMTMLSILGAWSSPYDNFRVDLGEGEKEFEKSVDGLNQFFGYAYRANAMSAKGLSREEYVQASTAYLAMLPFDMESSREGRLKDEGSRKK